jgi:hypothetical protein
MVITVDDALNLSVVITRGDRGWLGSMTTQGDAWGSNVVDYEFADMRWDKSLVQTEILVTAWAAGHGFDRHTTELTSSEARCVPDRRPVYPAAALAAGPELLPRVHWPPSLSHARSNSRAQQATYRLCIFSQMSIGITLQDLGDVTGRRANSPYPVFCDGV